MTTLEVSIYTTLRFDFDLSGAARLACLQLIICAIVVAGLAAFSGPSGRGSGPPAQLHNGDTSLLARATDSVIMLSFAILAVLPVLVVIAKGLGPHHYCPLISGVLARCHCLACHRIYYRGTGICLRLIDGHSTHAACAVSRSVWWLDVSVSLYLSLGNCSWHRSVHPAATGGQSVHFGAGACSVGKYAGGPALCLPCH